MKIESINRIGTMAAICAILSSLGGCTAGDDGRDQELEDDDRGVATAITLIATGADMVNGGWDALTASDSTGLFLDSVSFLEEIFGGEEEDLVTLSQESLDAIQEIVEDANVSFAFETYKNDLNSLVGDIGAYVRPDCDPTTSSDCATDYTIKSNTMFELSKDANRLWNNFNSEGDLHARERMLHVPHMVLVASLRTAVLAERAALDSVRQISAEGSREVLCDEAEYYAETLSDLKVKYEEYIDGQFGAVYDDQRDLDCYGGPGPCQYMKQHYGCFDGPEGQVCTPEYQQTIDGECDGSNLSENCDYDYMGEAERMREDAIEALYLEQVDAILGGDEFDNIISSFRGIADDQRCEECLPNKAIEAGPLWDQEHALETCPGVCDGEGGNFTGQWWTTVANEMSVCQCHFDC